MERGRERATEREGERQRKGGREERSEDNFKYRKIESKILH